MFPDKLLDFHVKNLGIWGFFFFFYKIHANHISEVK